MIIGLTGQAGSGKSFAQQAFSQYPEFEILDLDTLGHDLLHDDTVKQQLITEFGNAIQDQNQNIIRKELGNIVFSDTEKLKALNAIMHPVMNQKTRQWAGEVSKGVIVGALIEEIGLSDICDTIIAIVAKEKKRPEISQHQRSDEEYMASAHVVIENNFESIFLDKVNNEIKKILSKQVNN